MKKNTFKIAYLYPEELNLYGDEGNILYLKYFLSLFKLESEVIRIKLGEVLEEPVDFIFSGGGPDSLQNIIYNDFFKRKTYIKKHVEANKPALFICGSYQLLGNYYLTDDYKKIPGLGLFNFYTKAPKDQKNRMVGNLKAMNLDLYKDFPFSKHLVGFENHNGRTYSKEKPLGLTNLTSGNNTTDETEGFIFKKTVGTYLHGPILVKNPHLLFYMLQEFLNSSDTSLLSKSFYSEYISHYNILHRI